MLADPIYGSVVVTKLINQVMLDGKRGVAQKGVYERLTSMEKTGREPTEVFEQAMNNIMPVARSQSPPRRWRDLSGADRNPSDRRQTLGLRWLVSVCAGSRRAHHERALAAEIMDAANSQGNAFKKKEDTHSMAEANKAFAHYRW